MPRGEDQVLELGGAAQESDPGPLEPVGFTMTGRAVSASFRATRIGAHTVARPSYRAGFACKSPLRAAAFESACAGSTPAGAIAFTLERTSRAAVAQRVEERRLAVGGRGRSAFQRSVRCAR